MERVDPYRNVREMTPEVLLELTQSLKHQQTKRTFSQDVGLHSHLLITQEDIEDMAETLKMIVFFISPAIIRETIELARDNGVLRDNSNWLKNKADTYYRVSSDTLA